MSLTQGKTKRTYTPNIEIQIYNENLNNIFMGGQSTTPGRIMFFAFHPKHLMPVPPTALHTRCFVGGA